MNTSDTGSRGLEAIVLSGAGTPGELILAAELAATTGAFLVVVKGGAVHADAIASVVRSAGNDAWMIVDISAGWPHALVRSAADQLYDARWGWAEDQSSLGRNVGLLLARLCGWSRVLFVDDNVRGMSPGLLRRAGGLLDSRPAVAFSAGAADDLSVVARACGLAGLGRNAVVVSAGALAVNTAGGTDHFPRIYRNDVLFLLSAAQQPFVLAGPVFRDTHDPLSPVLAARQEFGELVAAFLLQRADDPIAGATFAEPTWADAIEARDRFLGAVIDRLSGGVAEPRVRQVLNAVTIARDRLGGIRPAACVAYMRALNTDRDGWRRRVEALPTGMSPSGAAGLLELRAVTPSMTRHGRSPAPTDKRIHR